jgi:hypothetical protein
LELIAEEPVSRSASRRRQTYSEIAEWLGEVRKTTGKTYRFYKPIYPSIAAAIRKGESYGATPGEFKAVTRRVTPDGEAAPDVAVAEHGVAEDKAEKYVWLYATALT